MRLLIAILVIFLISLFSFFYLYFTNSFPAQPSKQPLEVKPLEYIVKDLSKYTTFEISYKAFLDSDKVLDKGVPMNPFLLDEVRQFYKNSKREDLWDYYEVNVEREINRDEAYDFAYLLTMTPVWKKYYKLVREIQYSFYREEMYEELPEKDKKFTAKDKEFFDRFLAVSFDDIFIREILKHNITQANTLDLKNSYQKYFDHHFNSMKKRLEKHYLVIFRNLSEKELNEVLKIYNEPVFSKYRSNIKLSIRKRLK